MAAKKRSRKRSSDRLGVWIFGALGGLATTTTVGARAIAKGLAGTHGLLTATPFFDKVPLQSFEGMVFGGHDVRDATVEQAAMEIHESTGTIPHGLLSKLSRDLKKISGEIRPGSLINAGRTIDRIATIKRGRKRSMRAEVRRIQREISEFMTRNRLDRCVCVNLMSTEPKLRLTGTHESLAKFEAALDRGAATSVRPSALYAYAAAKLGLPFIHFTPSNATLIPAVRELFDRNGAPYMGCDGKTGETLVKSSLAPMFKYRNLQVLSWQGYNILGDRDGVVLADEENKRAKIETKDGLLSSILGYPLHTHVGIDYVPSLSDLKTAWDFIHFQGFLGYKMSLQFTWQGCDAILAAPIVLDMVRLADLASRRGESGPMHHLSCFFKRPLEVDEHDLHQQWHLMTDYVRQCQG